MFAGIGGICLGFKQAGFEVVWANDIDADAVKTYTRNHEDTLVVESDIKKIFTDTIPAFDILTAGFPCQSFSIRGKQLGFKDPRGNLFFEIGRVINTKRPRVVLLENVANLVSHDDGKTFLVIYNTLAGFGYFVKYAVLDAAKHGNIPQKRERIFIAAFLNETDCINFRFPYPIEPTVNLNDIIKRNIKHSDCYYYTESNYNYHDLQATVTDKNALYLITDYGVSKKKYPIASTLKANMGTFPDRVPVLLDDFGIRKLTPRECLDLQGFPGEFEFGRSISLNAAYKQAGNTVCVPVIKRIAEQIKIACLGK